jgi:ABC-type Fe3+ transport system permease subunit
VTAAGGDSKGGLNLRDGLKLVVNVLLFLLGAIAVIMIVVGGLRYVLSSGDSNQLTAAKNTILYAVVGLIVALLSYAIVNWVIDQFAK